MLTPIETALTFGKALEAVKEGKLIARAGWNGKGMFVFQRPSDKLNIRTVVEKVQLLMVGWLHKPIC